MKIKKYSENFNRDFNWYLKYRSTFDFDGHLDRDIVYSKDGIDGKQAFFLFDSQGILNSTRHPNILRSLLKTKGSINLHIKMWKEDRYNGILPKILFLDLIEEYELLDWMIKIIDVTCLKDSFIEEYEQKV